MTPYLTVFDHVLYRMWPRTVPYKTTYCTVYDHVLYRMYDFQIDALAREINQDDPYSHKRAAELDSTTVETYINSNMWMGGQ